MTRVVSFSSGKGGVGKTTLVANLGYCLAKAGKKTLLIDGDWTLGKLAITLGVRPIATVDRVLSGAVPLAKAIQRVGEGLYLLPAPSGAIGFEEMGEAVRNQLFYEIDALMGNFDMILIDHSSGIHQSVLQFAAASHQHVIVTTTEPTSYTDAYAIMKLLSKRFAIRDFGLLVTMSEEPAEAARVIARFGDVVRSHLDIRLTLLDIIPWEPLVAESIRRRQPFVERYAQHELTGRLERIGGKLEATKVVPSHGLSFFYGTPNTLSAR